MLMRKLALLLCSAMFVYAPGALADCTGLTCTSVYIEALNAEAGEMNDVDDVWVRTTGTETALTCTADSGAWLKLRKEAPEISRVYAMLLTAFTMDHPITIRLIGNQGEPCLIAYAYMTRS